MVNEELLNDDDVTLYGLFVEAFTRLKPLVHSDLGLPELKHQRFKSRRS